MDALLAEIRSCRACVAHLPLGLRPIVQASASARLLIVGQAPSMTVHATGVPWNDKSGEQLRRWLGLEREVFYDATQVAIMPTGYCYPGTRLCVSGKGAAHPAVSLLPRTAVTGAIAAISLRTLSFPMLPA